LLRGIEVGSVGGGIVNEEEKRSIETLVMKSAI
jgi:hypothetical protein